MPRVRSLSEGPFSPGQCLCAALSSPAMLPIAWRGPGRGPSLPGTSCGANQRLQPWRGGPPSAAGGALRGLPCAFFCTGAGSLRPAGPGAGDVFKVLNSREEEETSRMELMQRQWKNSLPPAPGRGGRAERAVQEERKLGCLFGGSSAGPCLALPALPSQLRTSGTSSGARQGGLLGHPAWACPPCQFQEHSPCLTPAGPQQGWRGGSCRQTDAEP